MLNKSIFRLTGHARSVQVRLPFDRDNQCLKGFGYVTFSDANGGPVRTCCLPGVSA